MSTTSTVSALVAHDHTLGDDSKLLNCMCVLAIARGDGTPFDATSIQEEGIVELCVEVGQVHSKGVLQFSVMESIVVFWSSNEILATVCMVTKAMAWQEEPVELHTFPPPTVHLRAYIAGRNACPLGTQSLTSEGEKVHMSPPRKPKPDWRAPGQFHITPRDLGLPNYGSCGKTSGRR